MRCTKCGTLNILGRHSMYCPMRKPPTHGGKRKGAGRPKLPKSKLKEKTKVMRVPVSLVETVQELIDRYNESKE